MRDWIDSLEDRTKAFAVGILRFAERLELTRTPRNVVWQLVDAGTSVAANHRACRRARSDRELVSKLAIVEEESDESALWLELIEIVREEPDLRKEARRLAAEAAEFRSIFSAGRATVKERLNREKQKLPKKGS
jgi:four helix bundle protein